MSRLKKYFILSFDDGTVHDVAFIHLLNRLGIHGTFNLNSGLSHFIWYKDDLPIYRFDLEENTFLYEGHEVASHSLTHPDMVGLDDEEARRQIVEDVTNLSRIFHRNIHGFAYPFSSYSEREIAIIRRETDLTYVRNSGIDESFSFPEDPYHISATTIELDRAIQLFPQFLKEKTGVFVFAGHSYDFYVNGSFDRLEAFLKEVLAHEDIHIVTMEQFVREVYTSSPYKS